MCSWDIDQARIGTDNRPMLSGRIGRIEYRNKVHRSVNHPVDRFEGHNTGSKTPHPGNKLKKKLLTLCIQYTGPPDPHSARYPSLDGARFFVSAWLCHFGVEWRAYAVTTKILCLGDGQTRTPRRLSLAPRRNRGAEVRTLTVNMSRRAETARPLRHPRPVR